MKTRQLLLLLLVLVSFGAFSDAPAWAKSKKKAPAPPADTRKLIKAIDLKAFTIQIADMLAKTTHTYSIDAMTVVQVGNLPGKFSDIEVGMEVEALTERDNDTLDSITVDTTISSPIASPKKKAKKPTS